MTNTGTKLLQGIDTVIIRVSNIEISKDWYLNKLGLTSVWDDAKLKLAVLDTNSATSLTLWQTDQALHINKHTTSYPIFRTQNAVSLRQELATRGVELGEVIEDDYVKYFFFFDPDGNVLEACEVHE
jgi:catechol 2,3-dioxygenase-like lactoylglutathione lyase family enzyme